MTPRTMQAWAAQQDGETRDAAELVACGLWAAKHNDPVPRVVLAGLAADVARLAELTNRSAQ